MVFSVSALENAAKVAGSIASALGLGKILGHLLGVISIDLVSPSIESYFYTPDAGDNRNVTYMGSGKLSYSKFRVKLRVSTSYKVRMHGVTAYAYHSDMPKKWEELDRVTHVISNSDRYLQETFEDFAKYNSRPHISEANILDNGCDDYNIEIAADEVRDTVIARVGWFVLSLPECCRKIDDTNYCDLLLLLHINAVEVALLCSVPERNFNDLSGPILLGSKTFHGAEKKDILAWAMAARPRGGEEGQRRGAKFRVKLRR